MDTRGHLAQGVGAGDVTAHVFAEQEPGRAELVRFLARLQVARTPDAKALKHTRAVGNRRTAEGAAQPPHLRDNHGRWRRWRYIPFGGARRRAAGILALPYSLQHKRLANTPDLEHGSGQRVAKFTQKPAK